MITEREEIADLWNRIENLERRLEVTRTNLSITIISVIIMGATFVSTW